MGRNGIVYQRLYTMFCEKSLQLVSPFTEDGELVINILFVGNAFRQCYQWIADMRIIIGCQLLTLLIVFIQILQLHT